MMTCQLQTNMPGAEGWRPLPAPGQEQQPQEQPKLNPVLLAAAAVLLLALLSGGGERNDDSD